MFKIKVYYEDTDSGGIVYYANYLKFLERARTQLLLDNNISNKILIEKFGIFIVVKSCNINYIHFARLEDDLEIFTYLEKKKKIRVFLNQKIYCKNKLIVEAKIQLVFVNSIGKVVPMPIDLYNIF